MNAGGVAQQAFVWHCPLCGVSGWAEDPAAVGDRLEQHINDHHRSA